MNKKYIEFPSTNFVSIIPDPNEVTLNIYNEVTLVPQNDRTSVVTYTVPIGKEFYLKRVEFSSSNISTIELEIDSTLQAKTYTWWTVFDNSFQFDDGIKVIGGKKIELFGEHNRPSVGAFSGRIFGVLK